MNFELNKQNKQNPDKYYEAQTTGPPPHHLHNMIHVHYHDGKWVQLERSTAYLTQLFDFLGKLTQIYSQ